MLYGRFTRTTRIHIRRDFHRKSGTPLGVLIPAPAITTTRWYRRSAMLVATACRVSRSSAGPPREQNPRGELVCLLRGKHMRFTGAGVTI